MTGHILLIEADVVLGGVLGEVLRHNGYEVSIVRTLKDKATLLQSASAVILDVDMINAETELARLSTSQLYRESLPIVLMGVKGPEHSDQDLNLYFGRLQARDLVWVRKPFRNEELLAAVRHVQERFLPQQANRM